jgi:putative iron-regulated protein
MKKITWPLIAIVCLLSACAPVEDTSKKEFVNNYAAIVFATYSDAYDEAVSFQTLAIDFVNAPTAIKYDALKQQYIDMRLPYEHSEAFRFYGGPIDNSVDGPEGLMNSWPMDEVFVDYVVGNPTGGVINDTVNYPTIDGTLIESLNQLGGESNVSCGYHAIEFLLWGQDLSTSGPGARPYTDYVMGGTAAHQDRRGDYLLALTDRLIAHLLFVKNAWDPNIAGNYRSSFVSNVDNSLTLLLTGMGKFSKGELAGERMTTALNNQSQEDEHSCFSDQTHNDLIWGEQSFVNLWNGSYTTVGGSVVSGKGIKDLITDEALKTNMQDHVNAAVTALSAIQPPFDQEIAVGNTAGNARVLTGINALRDQADVLVEVASHLGYNIVL